MIRTKPIIGKAITHTKNLFNRTSAVVGKAFSPKIKSALGDYSGYWIYGSIGLIFVLIWFFIMVKLHKKPKFKKKK